MRQLNIAQRSANFVASVRDCAFVVTNQVRLLLTDLLHAHLGTSDKRTGCEDVCSEFCSATNFIRKTTTRPASVTLGAEHKDLTRANRLWVRFEEVAWRLI